MLIRPTGRQGLTRVLIVPSLILGLGSAACATEPPFEIQSSDFGGPLGISTLFQCSKLSSNGPRTCEFTFRYQPTPGKNAYVSIRREFLGPTTYSDTGKVTFDVTLDPLPTTVALAIDGQEVAIARPGGEPSASLTINAVDAFASLEQGTKFLILLRGGIDKTFVKTFSGTKACVKQILDRSDAEFAALFSQSHHLTCQYYAQLNETRIATQEETATLLRAEQVFLLKEQADAEARFKAETGPAAAAALAKQLHITMPSSAPAPP
jgi:hypothetical protein